MGQGRPARSNPFVRNYISRPKIAPPMSLRLLAVLAVATLAAAGCAAKAPAGTLKALDYKLPVTGSIVAFYQPFANPNPTGAVPTAGPMTQCAQNQVPDPTGMNPTGAVQPKCKGPYSTFEAHLMLPDPTAGGYKVYAVGPGYELEVMSLKASGSSYAGTANVTTQDVSDKVRELQVRMDGVVLAVAPGTAGNHTLAVAPAVAALSVTGTYTGHHLEVTVAGLPANGTYMGKLYVADAASPTGYTAKEDFAVGNGKTTYDSKDHNIADFAQFHIHVGTSAVNLYKASIAPNAKK
jgi:hypothetical protein